MAQFNPFDKDIRDIEKEDLNLLKEREVAEGWFVEYKEQFTEPKKISQSIAAFANSDGGWLIIGIRDNTNNAAEEIVGFDLASINQPKEKLRDIIKSNISPAPYFESKLINISEDKVVLVVYVEQGLETPYLTKDGRIYRRVGEGKDPIPETDRYALQKLFERRDHLIKYIESFTQNQYSISQAQADSKQPFLEIYIFTEFNRFIFSEFYQKEFAEKTRLIFSGSVPFLTAPITTHLSFNTIYTSLGSYILREVQPLTSIDLGLTVEVFKNGNMRALLPISQITESYPHISHLSHYHTFRTHLNANEIEFLKFIDGYMLFSSVVTLFSHCCTLLKEYGYQNTLKIRFKITDTWRNVVYFDDIKYLEYITKNGLPICLKDEIEIPQFREGNVIADVDVDQGNSFGLFLYIFESIGIPRALWLEILEGLGKYLDDIKKH